MVLAKILMPKYGLHACYFWPIAIVNKTTFIGQIFIKNAFFVVKTQPSECQVIIVTQTSFACI